MNRKRTRRGRRQAAALLAGSLLFARPAAAHSTDMADGIAIALGVGLVAVAGDLVFTTYDLVVVGQGEPPAPGWMIAQTAFTAPQAILLNAYTFIDAAKESEESPVLGWPLLAAWPTTLAVFGAWSLASPDHPSPGARFGLSLAIGADAAFTSVAAGRLVAGEPEPIDVAVAQIAVAIPQVAVGIERIATTTSDRPGWIALGAVSGALLIDGAASLVWRAARGSRESASASRPVAARPLRSAAPRLRLAPLALPDPGDLRPRLVRGVLAAGAF